MHKITIPFARFALFIIYFWFGLLKVIGESPATPLVNALFNSTIAKFAPFITFDLFMILFGSFEMLIGIMFLIQKLDKWSIKLLIIHLITTVMPLFVLPALIWTKIFVPTLEGQYIIKNIAIIALAMSILVHSKSHQHQNV